MKDVKPSFDTMSKCPTQWLKQSAGERPHAYKAYINPIGKQHGTLLAHVQAGLRKPYGIIWGGATHST